MARIEIDNIVNQNLKVYGTNETLRDFMKVPKSVLPKKNKYNARKTTIDGITFDSAKEAHRWNELVALQKVGEISNLERQHKFTLRVNGEHICDYIADFVYYTKTFVNKGQKNEEVRLWRKVEDVKSEFTRKLPVYRIKKKLMKACLNIDILEA